MTKTGQCALFAASALLLGVSQAEAEIIGGVDFPQGQLSFADSVVSFVPGAAGIPSAAYLGQSNALGAPNYNGNPSCASQAACTFLSLGAGGALVLRFDDNVLTGSDDSDFDLWVFEVGPNVEDTTVDLSVDGLTWLSVGSVTGSTRGIDIDAFGFDATSAFRYVRLIDVVNEGGTGNGGSVGADIDALGAISTRPFTPPDNGVPEPSTWAMMLLGFAGLGSALRRNRRLRPI
ncbi:MAG: PEP-CTERM sorting domain-containing protein [Phenylobacterium sp.]|uniref:PEPxxWA-CTERM sorting domain-containing protein n=1 Tax=Phenylobacterium sp. TaxID=1871053 RepID=UPI0011F59003|nr:PEPxxWA-CTERM sorting domain-containing protein [Phenylobacterium sp.]TAJ73281.1 MAG: PEP-CTERM sorting domain-containing protein [Phenylobacterium sp.]